MRVRKIIHLDLDAFFCAVEELRQPELRGKPFAVGGRPDSRGVVSSCSYAARAFGIRSAMPMARAMRLCPELIIVSGAHHAYSEASRQVMGILQRYTALFEQVSIDEAFMDLTDLPKDGRVLAEVIQATIHRECNLPCSLGVATNKLVAKIANDFGKSAHRGSGTYPNAITVVPPGEEAAFLAKLPAQALWGIGPKTGARLAEFGILTIGQLAQAAPGLLEREFGKYGHELALHAQGIDDSPVITEHDVKSISQETTFVRDIRDQEKLHNTLRELSEQVAYRLRKDNLTASTVRIKVRWNDFTTLTRQATLLQPTDLDGIIRETATNLFDHLWLPEQRLVRLLGVGVSGLNEHVHQLSLWDTPTEKERRLLDAVDSLRARYGKKIVRRGLDKPPKK
jgi:DNA polymerase-4